MFSSNLWVMKNFRFNKIGRRLWRTIAMISLLWIAFSIYYYSTWTLFPDSTTPPISEGVRTSEYQELINEATMVFKNVSRRMDVPSVSLAVGHQGKLIWSIAEGYQDVNSLLPATPKTQYRIGSSSKSLTATVMALAIQDGVLDLDSKITQIKNWPRKPWDFSMRQLLSHTAGIGNYLDFGLASGKYTLCNCYQFNTATEGLKVFNSYAMLYEPGTDFAYSTFDVNLASAILEQRTQVTFPEYVNQKLFSRLAMIDSYADHTKPQSEHFATFYQTEEGWYREYRNFEQVYDVNLSYKWAGGGFISTPSDLVKLGNAWTSDTTFINNSLKQQFWTPVRLQNGEINEQEYAVGFRSNLVYNDELLVTEDKSFWIVHHGGVSKGSQNFLLIFPNYELVIDASINANVEPFSKLSSEVMKIAAVFLESLEKEKTDMYREIANEVGVDEF